MSKGTALRGLVLLVSAFGCGSSNSSGPGTTGSGGGAGRSGTGSSFGAPPVGGSPVPTTGAAGAAGTTGAGGTGGGAACPGDQLMRCAGTMSGPWCTETLAAGSAPFFSDLWANRPDDVWFVGGQFVAGPDVTFGMLAHFDGCTWTVTQRPDLPFLTGVWGAAPNDVWIVGDSGNAYHWNGSALTTVAVPGATNLNAVSGSSSSDVWAVGNGVFHWNGSAWVQSFASGGTDIWAVAPSDVWVASGATDALHFDGTTWTATALTDFGLFSIWGDGTQAYAGGEGQALFHFAGGSWTTLQGRGGSSQGVVDIGGLGADVFAVGDGEVLRLSGAAFTLVTDAPFDFYSDVWVSPTQVWLGAAGGVVTRRAR